MISALFIIPFLSFAHAVTVLTPQANYGLGVSCEVYSKYPVPAGQRMHLNLCFNTSYSINVAYDSSDVELGSQASASWGTTWNKPCRTNNAQDIFHYNANGNQLACTTLTYPPTNQACFTQDAAVYISISKETQDTIPVIINGLSMDACSLAQNQVTPNGGNSNAQVSGQGNPTNTNPVPTSSNVTPTNNAKCGYPAPPAPAAPKAAACQPPIPPNPPSTPDPLYGGGGGGGGGGSEACGSTPGVPPAAQAASAPPAAGYTVCGDYIVKPSGPSPANVSSGVLKLVIGWIACLILL